MLHVSQIGHHAIAKFTCYEGETVDGKFRCDNHVVVSDSTWRMNCILAEGALRELVKITAFERADTGTRFPDSVDASQHAFDKMRGNVTPSTGPIQAVD